MTHGKSFFLIGDLVPINKPDKDIRIDEVVDQNNFMAEALKTLIEMEERDNKGDPDRIFSDWGRRGAWMQARKAIAKVEGGE